MQAIVESKVYKINTDFFEIGKPYAIRFNNQEITYGICYEVSEDSVHFTTANGGIVFGASDFYTCNYSIWKMTEMLGDENCVENGILS